MKKRMVLLFIAVLLIGGCTGTHNTNVDNALPIDNDAENLTDEGGKLKNEGSSQGDIEEDINAEDLKEDQELTEIAEEEHKTEEDTLVPQEEVEEEKEDKTIDSQDVDIEEQKPEESNEEEIQENAVLNVFNTELPSSINLDIKYDKYPISYDYFVVLRSNINVRKKPTTKSRILRKSLIYEKLNLVEAIKGQKIGKYNSDVWYKVFWRSNNKLKYGYVFGSLGSPRNFQFDKMEEAINKLKNEVDNTQTAYISNYKNRNGSAPLYDGKTNDKYGVTKYQAAPAYLEPKWDSEFRYIPDGTLVTILDKNNKFYKIKTFEPEGEYWVPRKYVSLWNSIKELTKVIVVDRKNQNEGVFEYRDGKWNLISRIFATTGEKAKYKEETSLGYFMVIQKRKRFLYLDDETREISGYAPYAIRFNGGAYIHGVPVEFEIDEDEMIDPGIKEYLYTIGTVPRSHKCVRNYSSHAKFLYDWVEIGKSAVIVIE